MKPDPVEGTTRLRDVIKGIRSCKTAAEERNVVSEESARIRSSFRQENCPFRHRNVAKLIFFQMLGYNTQFAHIECLKLIVSKKYVEKKIGYLALVQLMGEDDELTLMAISSIKADLASDKHNVVGMALSAIANTANADMCRELAMDVVRLMAPGSPTSIRTKAILAGSRIVRKCPDLIEDYLQPALALVDETHTQTLGAGISLMLEIVKQDPERLSRFAVFSTTFQRSLKNLLQPDGQAELIIHNVVDVFTQCRLIEMLRLIGKSGEQHCQQMEVTLANVLSSTELVRQTGRAIVYECCKTILEIPSSISLRAQALNTLDSLIVSKENNTRFIALKALTREASVSPESVSKFRTGVLGCLQDPDRSVATMAVELLVLLVNQDNVKTIVKDLLQLLAAVEGDLKETIATKICLIAELHKYDQNWYVETMVKVLEITKEIGEDTVCRTVNTIVGARDLREYAVKVLFFSVRENMGQEALVSLATWCIGEYADLLVGGRRVPSLPALPTASEVVDLLQALLARDISVPCKQYTLTAVAKLAVRIPSQLSACKYVLENESLSPVLELQQRACEYLALLDETWTPLRSTLFAEMPIFEKEDTRVVTPAVQPITPMQTTVATAAFPAVQPQPPAPVQTTTLNLLEMDLLGDAPSAMSPIPTPPQGALADVFSTQAASSSQPPSSRLQLDAYRDSFLSISFDCFKEDLSHPEVTTILMTLGTPSPVPLTNVKVLPLAPKNLRVNLFAASSSTVSVSTPVTQQLKVTNASHGTKQIALKLKVEYECQGEAFKAEQIVSSFPVSF